jgi:hypothetical protein
MENRFVGFLCFGKAVENIFVKNPFYGKLSKLYY